MSALCKVNGIMLCTVYFSFLVNYISKLPTKLCFINKFIVK